MEDKAYKRKTIKLYPDEEQKEELARMFRCFRFAHNYYRNKIYENPGNAEEFIRDIPETRKRIPFLNNIDCKAIEASIQYINKHLKETGKLPPIEDGLRAEIYRTSNDSNNIRLKDGKLKIPKVSAIKTDGKYAVPTGTKIEGLLLFKNGNEYEAEIFITMSEDYKKYLDQVKKNFGKIKPWKHEIKLEDILKQERTNHCGRLHKRLEIMWDMLHKPNVYIQDCFEVDRGHEEGPEIHCVTNNGIILVLNRDKFINKEQGIVTILFARKKQVERLYILCGKKPGEKMLELCKEHEKMRFNRVR